MVRTSSFRSSTVLLVIGIFLATLPMSGCHDVNIEPIELDSEIDFIGGGSQPAPGSSGTQPAPGSSGTEPTPGPAEPEATLSLLRLDGIELALSDRPIPLLLSVKVSFSEPMDQASVEQAISFTDDQAGPVATSSDWDGDALIMRLDKPLLPKTEYTVALDDGAMTLEDEPVPAISEKFVTMKAWHGKGDLDGDGKADFVAGAPGVGIDEKGAVFVYMNKIKVPIPSLIIQGHSQKSDFGRSVEIIPDFDGDGKDELMVSASADTCDGQDAVGAVYIFTGKTISSYSAATLKAEKADLVICGSEKGDGIGFQIAAAGDLDGDGQGDIMVMAIYKNHLHAPTIYLFRGKTLVMAMNKPQPLPVGMKMINVKLAYAEIPVENLPGTLDHVALSGIGDINSDGNDDIAVGLIMEDNNSLSGSVYVFEGGPELDDEIQLEDAMAVITTDSESLLSAKIGAAGDWNADGFVDLIISQYEKTVDPDGKVWVISGEAITQNKVLDADAKNLAKWMGGDQEALGRVVKGIGDADGDGRDDLLMTAPQYSENLLVYLGRAFLRFGADAGVTPKLLSAPVNHPALQFGKSAASPGDIDSDGRNDLLIGAPGLKEVGAVYLWSSSSDDFQPLDTGSYLLQQNDKFGTSIASQY